MVPLVLPPHLYVPADVVDVVGGADGADVVSAAGGTDVGELVHLFSAV